MMELNKKEKAIAAAIEDSNLPIEPAELIIVSDKKKRLYKVEIEHDWEADNDREEHPDYYFSTIYILPEVRKAVEFSIGDKELSEVDMETLIDHKDDPDWLIIPLQVEIASCSAYNPRIFLFSSGFHWLENDKLVKGIDGFMVTNKKMWKVGTQSTESWEKKRPELEFQLQREIREYNYWMNGEIFTAKILDWEPISIDPMLSDIEDKDSFVATNKMVMGGLFPDNYDGIIECIDEWIEEEWHFFNPDIDKLSEIVKASFKEESIKCPRCGEQIDGYKHEHKGWNGVCLKCGAQVKLPILTDY